MVDAASAFWSNGAKLARESGCAIARQTVGDVDDDAEFRSVVVAVAAQRALDTGGLLCGGRDVVMESAKSLTGTIMQRP